MGAIPTMSGRQQKVMVQPINVIFRHLQQQTRVSLWLYDNVEYRIEGKILGFDEFMNVTLHEAEEVHCGANKERTPLGYLTLMVSFTDNLRYAFVLRVMFKISFCVILYLLTKG